MATIRGNVCNTYVHIDLILTETGTNVDKNTSTVSWKLVGYLGSGASSSHWYSNSYHSINVSINGSTVYSLPNTTQKAISIGTNTSASSPVTIASGTTTVPHNADGSKTCACSFSVVYRYNSAFAWKGSGNVGLTTIARASQPSCITCPNTTQNVGALGSTITIYMNSNSSNFRHTVRYAWGNKNGTIATNIQYNCQWKIPLDFASNIPNATSGWGTIYVDTYNGSKLIGTKSVTFMATVPASMVPSISSITCTDPKGYLSKYGGYVQNNSTLKVVVSASGSYSSSIKSYKIVANGVTYMANSPTTGVLITSGTNTITVSVTDSRGRTVTKTTTISVLAYTSPKSSYLTAGRCNSDGTANAEGTHIKIAIKSSITALNNKNSKSFKLEYKASDATSWTTAATYTAAYSIDTSEVIAASIDKSYRVRLTAKDDFKTIVKEVTAGTAFTLLDFYSSGKGMAVGKVAEIDELLDINLRTRHRVDEDFMIGAAIYGMDADGRIYEALYPRNSNGNLVIGYGNYENKSGDTNIYGKCVNFSISETPNPTSFKPYLCKSNQQRFEISTAGYVTNNGTNICFFVPCSRYVAGDPTPSAWSANGFIIRQSGKYTHGSNSTTYVRPSSYSVVLTPGGFTITAVMSSTTNAINNAPCGIRWSGVVGLN